MVVTDAEQQGGEPLSGRRWHAWRWLGKSLLLGLAWACGAAAGGTGNTGEARRAAGWIVHVDAPEAVGGEVVQVLPRPVFAVPAEKSGAGRAGVAAQRSRSEQAALAAQPGVRRVEPDLLGEFAAGAAPNDPGYVQQEWLSAAGASALWQVGAGQGITVAVIDSGVDLQHPDLAPNLLPGHDFADADEQPQDVLGHGTAVAGLVGAVCGNGLGGCGMAPLVKILPFKVSRSTGEGAHQPVASAVAAAIRRAAESGAQIINLSLSFASPVQLLTSAIESAQAMGVLIVAAAGNGLASPVAYPANLPGVIAVANSTTDGYLFLTSNFGPEVALAAAGVNPPTTLLGGGFGSFGSGTSFAAPQVAGALAALRSAHPRWSKGLLLKALQATSKPVPGRGFGSLQAGAAAQWLLPTLHVSRIHPAANDGLVKVAYRLPDSDGPVDVYVSVETPAGRFGVAADGSWWGGDEAPQAWRRAYAGGQQSGELFGLGGIFPPLLVNGLPGGSYLWQLQLIDRATGLEATPTITQHTRLP